MSIVVSAIESAERLPLPDVLLRFGVSQLVGRTSARLARGAGVSDAEFLRDMDSFPIAIHTDEANTQHYELPPAFFEIVLGPHRKYSCCLYDTPSTTLAQAERRALEETCAHADLMAGQRMLELGCGWGSLSFFMAERYPQSTVVSLSNSRPQRAYIEAEAARRGLTNLTVVTADMNVFDTDQRFDRIVSVEMFEHMSNWRALLRRAAGWLQPDGRMFIHVFSHRSHAYRFDHADKSDWIAQHFFTGGIMPSHGLIRSFTESFEVEADWQWNGHHYARTARDWLNNFDANRDRIRAIFDETYGGDAILWMRRWRLFFLATEGLFGFGDGTEWGVSHYRLRPVIGRSTAA